MLKTWECTLADSTDATFNAASRLVRRQSGTITRSVGRTCIVTAPLDLTLACLTFGRMVVDAKIVT